MYAVQNALVDNKTNNYAVINLFAVHVRLYFIYIYIYIYIIS